MLNIVGGTYHEFCKEPTYHDLYGSGLRAAAALSGREIEILLYSCIDEIDYDLAKLKSRTFNFNCKYQIIQETAQFHYQHPLSKPYLSNCDNSCVLNDLTGEYFLYFGMAEANVKIDSEYLVYDPQNCTEFSETQCRTKHLAIVLNRDEAFILGHYQTKDLDALGFSLLLSQHAEVIVIKNGSKGAKVFFNGEHKDIPVYRTDEIWPIGSGDIFSSFFALNWMIMKKSPFESANIASLMTANYCKFKTLPLKTVIDYEPIKKRVKNKIYLAGPFFSIEQRWLITEIRSILLDFDNEVFSPYHDVGLTEDPLIDSEYIANCDIDQLMKSDKILAVLNTPDIGTVYEIGFARAKNKEVIIFTQNIAEDDLLMLRGTNCFITSDFSTAIYQASW